MTKQNHKSEDITIFLNSLGQFSKKNAQIKLEYNKIDTRDHMLCSLLKIVFASGSEKVVCSALTDDDKPKLIQEDMVNSRFIVVNEEAFIERKGELLEIWNENKIQPKEVRSKVVASSINPIEQNRLS